MPPDFALERGLSGPVCGVDEAGRGPWAGPVVACAVILDPDALPPALLAGIDDSKKLSPARRAALVDGLRAHVAFGLGLAEAEEIDRVNILRATGLAMQRAVAALPVTPAHALVDGNRVMGLGCAETPIVGGDARSLSIAAASILAKTHRDGLMAELALSHPGYGWERNAGYGVPGHAEALERLGPTPQHRFSFAPVRRVAERLGLTRSQLQQA